MSDKKDLEKRFAAAKEEFDKEIKVAEKEAIDAVNKITAICEKYGIPHYSSVSPLSNNYTPGSLRELWPDSSSCEDEDCEDEDCEDEDCEEEHQSLFEQHDIYLSEYNESGWEHSSVC